MKTYTQPIWMPASSQVQSIRAESAVSRPALESDLVDQVRVRQETLVTPMRVVGVLAFVPVALMAVIILFCCAKAGAATPVMPIFKGDLRASEFAPTIERDPFGGNLKPVVKSAGQEVTQIAVPVVLKLQGIMYHATRPAALVNDKVVELNKPVTVKTEQGDVEVRALEITREIVLLEVGGQKMELRLGAADREKVAK